VPVSLPHGAEDGLHEGKWDVLVEQIAHRVDEDQPRTFPCKRYVQALRPELQVETLLVRMIRYTAKPLRERLGIAVGASRTDLVATSDGVPGGVCPLDLAAVGHAEMIGIGTVLVLIRCGAAWPHDRRRNC